VDEEWKNLRQFRSLEQGFSAAAGQERHPDDTLLDDAWDLGDDSYTPFPSNLPTSEGFGPRTSEFWSLASLPAYNLTESKSRWQDLKQVYVILFGVGESETEGIYSLRALSKDEGVPQDTIIAFENEDDAERYAGLLEATMDHVPHVCPIEAKELLDFCVESGYCCRLEVGGSLLIPPDFNVGMTDWERSLRLREGLGWSVLDSDPSLGGPSSLHPRGPLGFPMQPHTLHNNAGAYSLPDHIQDLDEVKARLERLMQSE
jgi:hypothetical protein